MNKKQRKFKNKLIVISSIIIALIFFLPVMYRATFSDLEMSGMKKQCELQEMKLLDGSPQGQAIFIDLEGAQEDSLTFTNKVNMEACYQLQSNPDKYQMKYILFGRTAAATVSLVLLFIFLVITGSVIIYGEYDGNDDDEEDMPYY